MHYLVKWKGLGYEDCTWEAAADLLPKFQAEIQRFKEQHPIANELAQRKRSHSQVLLLHGPCSLTYGFAFCVMHSLAVLQEHTKCVLLTNLHVFYASIKTITVSLPT